MENLSTSAPEAEQAICVRCGFCCDGTLFLHAVLQPGEKGNLPEKIEERYYLDKDGEFFKMPCPYFCKKCTIYTQEKAEVCSSFRCQLLKDFASGKISPEEALTLVKNAATIREELIRDFNQLNPARQVLCFREMLLHLGEFHQSPDKSNETVTGPGKPGSPLRSDNRDSVIGNRNSGTLDPEPISPEIPPLSTIDILTARCNILEAQLIRYFRSAEEYDQLVMGNR